EITGGGRESVAVHWKHGGGSGEGHDNQISIAKDLLALRGVVYRDPIFVVRSVCARNRSGSIGINRSVLEKVLQR
ncbi:MAG: hypothetical protein O3A31_08260, partial [Planctomycetota bacterium]|nr:hypothetical protein [Planctomycetota bacterium]